MEEILNDKAIVISAKNYKLARNYIQNRIQDNTLTPFNINQLVELYKSINQENANKIIIQARRIINAAHEIVDNNRFYVSAKWFTIGFLGCGVITSILHFIKPYFIHRPRISAGLESMKFIGILATCLSGLFAFFTTGQYFLGPY